MTKKVKWFISGVVVITLVIGGYFYWRHGIRYPSTSDAYVHADVVRIAPRIDGQVSALPVHEHQHVKKGQLLVKIDPAPFQIALENAQAHLELAQQQAKAAAAVVDAARAEVSGRQAQLDDAKDNAQRILRLYKQHFVPKAQADQARTSRDSARAALIQAQADLEKAIEQRGSPGATNAEVKVAKAVVKQARLDLSHTRIVAPAAGVLGSIEIRPGDVVTQGQALMPLVEDGTFWVAANFKETDLQRINDGQPATITLDMYPDKVFHGSIESMAPASGVAFSLLPPENATGNWVKVTQRFPIRIHISRDTPDPGEPLRIGASAQVTVDTVGKGSDDGE